MENTQLTDAKLLKDVEVCHLLSIGRSTLWEGSRTGIYPSPIKIGSNTRWLFKDLLEYICEQIEERSDN